MRISTLCVIALALVVDTSCSPTEPRELTAEDLGIVCVSDNSVIMLDATTVDTVIDILGEPLSRKVVKYQHENKEEDVFDQIRLSYDGIALVRFRGFDTAHNIIITDSKYRALGGFSIGDNIRDVKRIYSDVYEYDDFAIVSLFDGEIGRGFAIEHDGKGKITKILLSVFSP